MLRAQCSTAQAINYMTKIQTVMQLNCSFTKCAFSFESSFKHSMTVRTRVRSGLYPSLGKNKLISGEEKAQIGRLGGRRRGKCVNKT